MKTKLNFLIFFTIGLLFTNTITAQDSTNTKSNQNYKYGIGLGAGFTTGYGISFKYLPNKFGAQINFAPYKNDNTEQYSIGLTFIYTLIAAKKTNFYLYQGNHYYYNSVLYSAYNYNNNYHSSSRSTTSYVNNGLGIGARLFLGNRFELNFMTGYAFYDNFKNINLTAETALYYRF